jgi:hypothetical protein
MPPSLRGVVIGGSPPSMRVCRGCVAGGTDGIGVAPGGCGGGSPMSVGGGVGVGCVVVDGGGFAGGVDGGSVLGGFVVEGGAVVGGCESGIAGSTGWTGATPASAA